MKIKEAHQWAYDAFSLWLQCFARPVVTLNALLRATTGAGDLSSAAKIWTASELIALIPMIPILHLYGIEWDNVGFYLSSWLFTALSIVMTVFFAHRILTLRKLKSEFTRTLVMYTTPVVSYSPIFVLVNFYPTILAFEVIQMVKKEHLPIADAFLKLLRSELLGLFSNHDVLSTVMSFTMSLLSLSVFTIFAEAVSQWYGNDRFKSYSAVSLAAIVSAVTTFSIVVPLKIFTVYAFVSLE